MDNLSTQETLAVQGFTPYAQIPKWIIRSGDALSHGAVRLYGAIMTYADNDTKAAFPGREKLAENLGIKVRSISTYIKELEDFGALNVTRRRNKRTGNFYANHYVLVFNEPSAEYCTPPDAVDCPRTTPTVLNIDPPLSTSDASAPDPQKNCTSDKSDNLSRSKQASPATNPGGLTQGQRKILRNQLVTIGKMLEAGKKFYSDDVQEQWDTFIGMMEDAFPDDFDMQFADMLLNGKWTVSAKVATPYGAGVELNKIVNTALSQ